MFLHVLPFPLTLRTGPSKLPNFSLLCGSREAATGGTLAKQEVKPVPGWFSWTVAWPMLKSFPRLQELGGIQARDPQQNYTTHPMKAAGWFNSASPRVSLQKTGLKICGESVREIGLYCVRISRSRHSCLLGEWAGLTNGKAARQTYFSRKDKDG